MGVGRSFCNTRCREIALKAMQVGTRRLLFTLDLCSLWKILGEFCRLLDAKSCHSLVYHMIFQCDRASNPGTRSDFLDPLACCTSLVPCFSARATNQHVRIHPEAWPRGLVSRLSRNAAILALQKPRNLQCLVSSPMSILLRCEHADWMICNYRGRPACSLPGPTRRR